MTNFSPSTNGRTPLISMLVVLAWLTGGQALAQSTSLPNRHDPLEGVTTAGQPNPAQLAASAASGFKTVIDLRGADEDRGMDEKAIIEGLGMSYVTLPVEGGAGVTYANAAALDRLLAQSEGPVLIHCSTSNRAGALLALRAKLNGEDVESALALGVAGGVTGLKQVVEQKLAQGHD
jgi:uncharacterized protein (TIGR01244 family)